MCNTLSALQSFTSCSYIRWSSVARCPPPQQTVASLISFLDTRTPVAADNGRHCNLTPRVLLHGSESVQQRQLHMLPPSSQSLPPAGGQRSVVPFELPYAMMPWSIGWSSDVELRWCCMLLGWGGVPRPSPAHTWWSLAPPTCTIMGFRRCNRHPSER